MTNEEIKKSIIKESIKIGFETAEVLWESQDGYQFADKSAERLFFFKQGMKEVQPLIFEDFE
jgi:hypothetical protein